MVETVEFVIVAETQLMSLLHHRIAVRCIGARVARLVSTGDYSMTLRLEALNPCSDRVSVGFGHSPEHAVDSDHDCDTVISFGWLPVSTGVTLLSKSYLIGISRYSGNTFE
jgi:hypothetical protein